MATRYPPLQSALQCPQTGRKGGQGRRRNDCATQKPALAPFCKGKWFDPHTAPCQRTLGNVAPTAPPNGSTMDPARRKDGGMALTDRDKTLIATCLGTECTGGSCFWGSCGPKYFLSCPSNGRQFEAGHSWPLARADPAKYVLLHCTTGAVLVGLEMKASGPPQIMLPSGDPRSRRKLHKCPQGPRGPGPGKNLCGPK